jgi:hypothetical protein
MILATLNKLCIYKELPMQQLLLGSTASQKFENQQVLLVIHQTWNERCYGKIPFKEMEDFRALNSDLDFKSFDKPQKDTYMGEYWKEYPIFSLCMHSQFEPNKLDYFALKGYWASYTRVPFHGESGYQPEVL